MRIRLTHSVRTRLVIILVGFTALSVMAAWFINRTFMESYYVENKTKDLLKAYDDINAFLADNEENAISQKLQMAQKLASRFETEGISALVVDSDLMVTFGSGFGITNEMLMARLKDILFNNNKSDNNFIKNTESYVIQKMHDEDGSKDYLEMCGQIESTNDFFIMRSSLESITDTVTMANNFYLRVGLVIIVAGSVAMMIFSIRFTKPILKLEEISKKMCKLDFNVKYDVKGQDEIAVLGQNMNNLSEILEKTISELKSANVKLKTDIQKMTEIDEMRKDLSNVSHELKTPIALIQGYAEGLKESVNDDDESRDFYCDVIIDESAKMNKMVKKLLTLNQIEFGNNYVEMERFDLIAVIDQVLNQSNILLQEESAEVFFDNQKQMFVWADEFQIEEVITNYVSNAIHHLDFEKKITIELEEKEDIVRVNVFNTGRQIPESELDKVWIKFYKVDKARTREYGGSGIGLSIVKAIMDSMNMKCGVENRQNGVNFWFEVEKDKN